MVEIDPTEEEADTSSQTARTPLSDDWQESLRKLDDLPKSKAQLKADAKAEKERLKAEAKAEKQREKLRKRAEKESAQQERLAAQQRAAREREEAEKRRIAEEEMRKAERKAEEERLRSEKSDEESLRRAEDKASKNLSKAEKKAAVLAAVAASQAAREKELAASTPASGQSLADENVLGTGQDSLKAQRELNAQRERQAQALKEEQRKAAAEEARRQKEAEQERKAAEKAAAKEAEQQRKADEARRKEEEKRAKKEQAEQERKAQKEREERERQAKKEKSKQAKLAKAEQNAATDDDNGKKRGGWLKWLILLLLLLLVAAAALYFFKVRNSATGDSTTETAGRKHLDVSVETPLTYNPDMIIYSDREIDRSIDIVCANMRDYVANYLAERDYLNARVPMMDRVRQYAGERLEQLLGPRFAVQRFIPYDDYLYEQAEPWLKHTYADVARHTVQGELMNLQALDDLLDRVVDELGIQPGTAQRAAAEAQQPKATAEQPAQVRKPKTKLDKDAPVYVYVEKNSKQGFDIVAGFYLNKTTAAQMTARLHELGCDAYIIEKNDMYYVSMGSAPTRTKAEALYNHIKSWYDGDIAIKEL